MSALGPAGGPPGALPGQTPYDPSEADPVSQAVWGAFPGTDPEVVHQIAAPLAGGGPGAAGQVLSTLFGLFEQDEDRLQAMHQEQLNAILAQLMQPDPGAEEEDEQPDPAVGGEAIGF